MKKNKKGDFELDQLGKLILGGLVLLFLLYIVGWYIGGRLDNSESMLNNIFRGI